MAGIDIKAKGQRLAWALHLASVSPHFLDEGALLFRLAFPQKPADLMEGDTDAGQEIFQAGQGVDDLELLLDPGANLFGTAEVSLGDFGLEQVDLPGGE